LRRGSTLAVGGGAVTSFTLALVAEASGQGSWVAAVGLPSLGLAAAAELGVALDRLALVSRPEPGMWSTVVAALVDAVDIVLVGPSRIRATDARRLTARSRERGAVLITVGAQWPEPPDVTFHTGAGTWVGLGVGHGHLRARMVPIEVTGRREAARPRRDTLWLPADDGGVATVARPPVTGPAELRSVG
jgi:hypothetical protein